MTILKSLRGISVAAWIAIVGLVASVVIFGWSIPRGFEMGFDEGSHYLETARPWDSGYFHTLYAWYGHAVWKVVGGSVIRMRWFALLAQLACTAMFVRAAHGWFHRARPLSPMPLQVLMPLALTWSLLCYTLGSVTVTYTSLSAWVSTLWLALVLHLDNRTQKPSMGAVLGVWMLALVDCTAKPSTGAFLLTGSTLLTVGWWVPSFRTSRRIHLGIGILFLGISALFGFGLLKLNVDQNAWNLTLSSSPVANFISWAARYLASDGLRAAIVSLWTEPLREMSAALTAYLLTVSCAVAFLVVTCLPRLREWFKSRAWLTGGAFGLLIEFMFGGFSVVDHLSANTRTVVLSFTLMLVFSTLSADLKAGGAALLCVFVSQLILDAVGIVLPGETFFWAADYEFRIVFLLLLGALVLWLYHRKSEAVAQAGSDSANRPLLFLFLLAMPVIGWFGSGCFLGARGGYQYAMWVVLILLVVSGIGPARVTKQALLLTSLIMTMLAVNAVFVCRVLRPIDAGYPSLSQETKEVKVGPRSETLIFERKVGGFVSRVKSVLKENGFTPGGPVFALYNFPGLVFLVDGISPGTSWYVQPTQSAHVTAGALIQTYNAQRIRDIPLEQAQQSFVLQTDDDASCAELLAVRGMKFPDEYTHCATVTIPAGVNGKRKLDIWKPKGSTPSLK